MMEETKNISILLLIRNPVGGIRTYIRYVYGQSVFKNCQFFVLFCESDVTELFVKTMSELGFEYRICKDNNLALLAALCKHLQNRRYDIIHSHGFTSGVITSILAKIYSVPHIMTAHDVMLQNQFVGIKGKIKKKLLPYFFNSIDTIHTVSKDVENNVQGMLPQVERGKLLTIFNGVNVHEYSQIVSRNLRKELNLERNVYLIGFMGRFMSQKGFRHLIDAVELLLEDRKQEKEFRIIAVGSGGFIREDKELVRIKGLDDYFIFLPAVNNTAALLKGLNVIAVPSLWEASSLITMEALILGIPVIASDCIGLREVTLGTPAFIFRAGDSRGLANMIRLCLINDRKDDFERYQLIARERFDSFSTARELLNLYHRTVELAIIST